MSAVSGPSAYNSSRVINSSPALTFPSFCRNLFVPCRYFPGLLNVLNFFNSIGPAGSILLGMQFGYCVHLLLRGNYYNRKDSDKSKIGHDNLLAAGPRRRL